MTKLNSKSSAGGSSTLEDYLPFLLPSEAPSLISREAEERIRRATSSLLPIPRIAVECRPQADVDQVDVQQNIQREADEYPLLAQYAEILSRNYPESPEMKAFAEFCAELATTDSVLWCGISEIYLEFDLLPGSQSALPSIFLALPEDGVAARRVVERSLVLLAGNAVWQMLQPSVERCMQACPGESYVASIGIMLGRASEAIRMNVKRLLPAQVESYLAACEYTGDAEEAAAQFDAAVMRCDRVALALDVGKRLYPRIGLECFLDEGPIPDLRWKIGLEELCREGLCSLPKVAELLTIPADILPTAVGRAWPMEFIQQSLARPENHFSTFARRLTHFKVTHTLGLPSEAKVYFGAGHLWVAREDTHPRHWKPTLTAATTRKGVSAHVSAAGLERAIADAAAFLLERQLQSGFWMDFKANGLADEWVSAFVAVQLLESGSQTAVASAVECADRLRRTQRTNGGWGYSRHLPPDSDSTAWTLRLFQRLGITEDPAFERGRAFLLAHTDEEGGVRTYVDHQDLAPRIDMPRDASFQGWEQPHGCVTAAAAPFLEERSREYLRRAQHDGCWTGYWWVHDAYATAMTVDALQDTAVEEDQALIARAKQWATQCIQSEANAFDIAFCLRILLSGKEADRGLQPAMKKAVHLLLSQQFEGGWLPAARLRIPQPHITVAYSGTERVHLDYRGNFTTAAVLGALSLAHRRGLK